MKLTLLHKLGALLLLPLVGALLTLGYVVSVLERTATADRLLNVAGRQRMLAAELRAWSAMVAQGQEEDRPGLRERVERFEEALQAIESGGTVLGQPIEPSPPAVQAVVQEARRTWETIRPDLRSLIESPAADPGVRDAFSRVEARFDGLRDLCHHVVEAQLEHTAGLRRRLLYALAAGAAGLLGIFLFGLDRAHRYVVRPLRQIETAAHGIGQGDFSRRVAVSTRDELATLAATFNDMSARIERLLAERRNDLESLGASEMKFRTLFESSSDAVMMLDEKGFFDCNDATVRMFACRDKAEFCARHPADLSPPVQPCGTESMVLANQRIATALDRGSLAFEWTHRRLATGEDFPAEVLLSRMTLEGRPVLQATVRDVTERKRAEQERERLHAQLAHAQRMDAIGHLAGGIAHDFNNMLSVILGYVELALLRPTADEKLRALLREVRGAGQRAADLTRQILAFGRKQVLQPVPLDLNRVLQGMEGMLRRLIRENIVFVLQPASDLAMTLADPTQVEQVVMNLVVNARDAMPRGGTLTLATANVELRAEDVARLGAGTPGPHVMLAVTDTGHGMDAATRNRIFEPFFTTKSRAEGTGLGLSTAYGIVTQSGGTIGADSEPGKGSCFRVYLPRSEAPAPAAPREPTPTGLSGGRETILVVEDEEGVRDFVEMVLGTAGYSVLSSRDGVEALQLVEADPGRIDLVLTDVVMPGISGRELTERLAALRPNLPFIYMSGYTDDALSTHGVLDPKIPFLHKPFEIKDLLAKVRSALEERRRA